MVPNQRLCVLTNNTQETSTVIYQMYCDYQRPKTNIDNILSQLIKQIRIISFAVPLFKRTSDVPLAMLIDFWLVVNQTIFV